MGNRKEKHWALFDVHLQFDIYLARSTRRSPIQSPLCCHNTHTLSGSPLPHHYPRLHPPPNLPPHHKGHGTPRRHFPPPSSGASCRRVLRRPTTVGFSISQETIPKDRQTPRENQIHRRGPRPRLHRLRSLELVAPPQLRRRASYLDPAIPVGRVRELHVYELDVCRRGILYRAVPG